MCEVEGIYDIKCDVTRKDDGLEIGTVYSTATINKQLVEHKAFTVGIEGQFIAEAGGRISIEAKPSIPMSELPAVTWEWDWGDDSQIEIKSGSTGNQVHHGYAKNGKYQVRLAVKDMATKQILCECSQDVIIDDTILFSKVGSLSGTVWLPTKLEHGNIMNRIYTFANTEISLLPWSIDRFWNGSSTGTTSEFHCAGLQFTGETYSTGTSVAAGTQTTKNTVTGTISRDPLKIATLEYTVTHKAPDYNGTGKYWEYTKTIVIQNVPIDKRRGGDKPWFNIKLTGTDIQKYVTSASYESYLMEKDGTIAYQKFVQFDWNNSSSSGGATLEISFGEQY
jgi:PKD repeat protein